MEKKTATERLMGMSEIFQQAYGKEATDAPKEEPSKVDKSKSRSARAFLVSLKEGSHD